MCPLSVSASRSVLPLALLVSVSLCGRPVAAQQPVPATPPMTAPMTPPMAATSPVVPEMPEMVALPIPAPPGAKLRFEMDARSEDLLGLVKGFLKGIGETHAAGQKAPALAPGQPPRPFDPIEEALASGNLADVLKNVNHLHFMAWETTPPVFVPPPPTALPNGKAKPKALMDPPLPAPDASPFDTNAFYENAFAAEGAHRILYTDADTSKLVMVGFPNHNGFAFAVSSSGFVAAARADGYPDLEALTAFMSRLTAAIAKTKAGQDALNNGMGKK